MSRGATFAAFIVPFILAAQQLALGANSHILALIAAIADISIAILVLHLVAPDTAYWRGAWPILVLVLAAIAWVVMPAFAPHLFDAQPPRPAPDLLLPGVTRLFGGFALLLCGSWIGYRRGMMKEAIAWVMMFGVMLILIGAVMAQIDDTHVWGVGKVMSGDRFTGTLLNANATGTCAAVTALLGVTGLLATLRQGGLQSRNSWGKDGWVARCVATIAGTIACFASGSRTGGLLMICLMIAVILMDRALRRAVMTIQGAVVLTIVLATALFVFVVGAEVTLDRMGAIMGAREMRVEMLGHYLGIALASPWIGYGPLAFDSINQVHMGDPLDALIYWYVHAPHNSVISLLLTGGLPYLGLLWAAGALILRQAFRGRRNHRQDPLYRGLILSLALIVTGSMVDIQMDVPSVSGLTLFLFGLLWGRALRVHADRRAQNPAR